MTPYMYAGSYAADDAKRLTPWCADSGSDQKEKLISELR